MTGSLSFLQQPQLNWLAVISSRHWFYDFGATSFHNLKKLYFFSNFWFLFKSYHIILSIIDSSHWLREGVQLIMDKNFREKLMV